jgi:hypothetical protein
LGEHFVYTEEAAGSIPAPPIRLLGIVALLIFFMGRGGYRTV